MSNLDSMSEPTIPTLTPDIIVQLKERYAGGLPLFRTGDPYIVGPDGQKRRNTAENVIQGLPFPVVYRGLNTRQAMEVYESVRADEFGPDEQAELQQAYTEAFALAGVVWPENFGELIEQLSDQIGFGVLNQIADKIRIQSGEVLNPLLVEDQPLTAEGWPAPSQAEIERIKANQPGQPLYHWSYRNHHFIYGIMTRRSFDSLALDIQGEILFMLERDLAPSRPAMLAFVEKHIYYPAQVDWDNLGYGYLYQLCRVIYRASGFKADESGLATDIEL